MLLVAALHGRGRGDLRDQPLRPRAQRRSDASTPRWRAARPRRRRATAARRMKRVRFWGTRGSLPVALTAAGVRHKLRERAARRARPAARQRDDVERVLDQPALRHRRHLRRPQLLRADRDRRRRTYFVCDMGSGLRALRPGRDGAARRQGRRPSTSSCPTCTGTTSWACRSSCRPSSRATGSSSTAATASLEAALRRQQEPPSFPVDFSIFGADDGVRAPRARARATTSPASSVTPMLQRHTGDSYGYRFEARRQGRGLLDRFRAPAGPTPGTPSASSTSSATPTW